MSNTGTPRGEDEALRATRADDRDDAGSVVAYQDEKGAETALGGDKDAPYFWPFVRASQDGTTGLYFAQRDGEAQRIAADRYGRLWIANPSQAVPASYDATTNPAGENHHTVAGAHLMVEVVGYNGTGAPAYLMIFDAAALPANGTVPTLTPIAASVGATVAADVESGVSFVNGITVAFSSTPLTLTVATPASFTIFYR